jgi:hypothetical protein
MNCFVIMPFAREFDDVYATITQSVEGASREHSIRCFRLDESRPAGRITDRLLQEIQAAAFCIADITGAKPNVMWEVGYAMALGKPTLILSQEKEDLPFDIRDMESLRYDRHHLSESLGRPLKQMTIDTIASLVSAKEVNTPPQTTQNEFVGELLEQIRDLRSMVSEAVKTWNPAPQQAPQPQQLPKHWEALEGVWVNRESGTHLYARVIDEELVAPYCYGGNDRLIGVYYGWKRIGEFVFARFCWLAVDISGFSFLKHDSVSLLTGAWWGDDEVRNIPDIPNLASGVSARWERIESQSIPTWATQFFEEVRREGIVNRLMRRST